MLIKSIQNSIKQVLYNPSLVLFPVLFLIIINLLLAFIISVNLKLTAFILCLCAIILSVCFIAGWFNVIKNSFEIEKLHEKKFFAIFLDGVGKNSLVVALGTALYAFLMITILFLSGYLALKLFGSLDFVFKDLQVLPKTSEAFYGYIKSLPTEKLYTIYAWQMLFMLIGFIGNFLMMFYYPSLVEESYGNVFAKPFIAIKNSIIFAFRHFLPVLIIYILIYGIYFILVTVNSLFGNNMIVSGIVFFIYIYFITTSIVLIFNYYENNGNYGANRLGENKSGNQNCESN